MSFKNQLADDFEKIFMNKDEFADTIVIDGSEVSGIFEEVSGEYEEAVPTISIASSVIISEESIVVVNGRTYCVVLLRPVKFGERIVVLGKGML